MEWQDARLKYSPARIAADYMEGDWRYYARLWTPSFQVSNNRENGKTDDMAPLNVMVRVMPSGLVIVNKK